MRRILSESYVGPILVAYLTADGLRVLINAVQYPATEGVVRILNFILIKARTEIVPANETSLRSLFLILPLSLVGVAIFFAAAALLARYLYPRIGGVVPLQRE